MDKIGEHAKGNNTSHAKKLPAEIVGRTLQNLSVGDRLKNERVSPLWKRALQKWGWTEDQKLDANIVFDGASEDERIRFWENLDEGNCHLVSLLRCCAPLPLELDLHSFGKANIRRFLPEIVESLQSIKKLERLNFQGFRLQDFVDNLPPTLRELKTSDDGIAIGTLQALSNRCPNLEEVPFRSIINKHWETETVVKLIGKFPRQKKLSLIHSELPSQKVGALALIGELKALEELELKNYDSLDQGSFEAIIGGCKRLRSLSFMTYKLTEAELFQLTKLSHLTVLDVLDESGQFSDAVLKAIAVRGQLKKLVVISNEPNESLTDNSILYLVDRCKSLVSLTFFNCLQITERSLEAVIAEVQRRHGAPPRTAPTGSLDPGIFYFGSVNIDEGRAHELVGENPWLIFWPEKTLFDFDEF